ncbi:hypothetical protein [uncultured Gammaproteobacteria bacterium]|nr:hypothetical protein [uncultured Gammaproteobacteria bacterium]CAC9624054.1 hypothetical protein [uncultured Gammaproteobacteria bacterium]
MELYKGDIKKLKKAFDSTSVGAGAVATSGKMSVNTVKKILKGEGDGVLEVKANGMINGLNENGAKPKVVFDDIFTLVK